MLYEQLGVLRNFTRKRCCRRQGSTLWSSSGG